MSETSLGKQVGDTAKEGIAVTVDAVEQSLIYADQLRGLFLIGLIGWATMATVGANQLGRALDAGVSRG